jgi:hypothetical protein
MPLEWVFLPISSTLEYPKHAVAGAGDTYKTLK